MHNTEFNRQLQLLPSREQIISINNMADTLNNAKAPNIDSSKILRVKEELKFIRHKILLDN